jgi:hypothetical protein
VKKRGHLYFAYLRNAVCFEQQKPWSECRRIRKDRRFDLYKIKAESSNEVQQGPVSDEITPTSSPAQSPAPSPAPRPASSKSRRKGGRRGKVQRTAEDKAACPSGGKLIDGECWHLSLTGTSCEETCVEKDLQYDERTDLGVGPRPDWANAEKADRECKRINIRKDFQARQLCSMRYYSKRFSNATRAAQDKCLDIAAKFGFRGKKTWSFTSVWRGEKRSNGGGLMFESTRGCGCTVYIIPAISIDDEVRLSYGEANAQCGAQLSIEARLCACKTAAVIGGNCTSSSGCKGGYCKSGICTKLLTQDSKCSDHASCTTGYCSPSEGKCTTLAWKSTQGSFARRYRKSGKKRSKGIEVPNWKEMTNFTNGFCIGYYSTTTGCMVARGINRQKTIEKAKQRCAQSAECKAVWCCATACPATTCYAVKAETPNYKAKDCPDAPGSFHETKYPATYYTKDAEGKAEQETKKQQTRRRRDARRLDVDEGKTEEKEEPPEDTEDADGEAGKIYKLVKTAANCKFRGNSYTRLNVERTVDDCAEAVKQRNGLFFAFDEKRCWMAPRPWSEGSCRKGKFDLYEIEAGAGDDAGDAGDDAGNG